MTTYSIVKEQPRASNDREVRRGYAHADAYSTTSSSLAYARLSTVNNAVDSRHKLEVQDEDAMIANILPAQVRAEIVSYQRPANYYGEGSFVTSAKDCKAAIDFLVSARLRNSSVQMPSSISPLVDGGVALYWEKGECQLFIEVSGKVGADLSYQHVSADGTFSTGTAARANLIESLSTMYSR